jgi:integrase
VRRSSSPPTRPAAGTVPFAPVTPVGPSVAVDPETGELLPAAAVTPAPATESGARPSGAAGRHHRKTPYLTKRGGVYTFVRRYPEELIQAGIYKKPADRKSLKTTDRRRAEELVRQEAVRFDLEVAAHFAELKKSGRIVTVSCVTAAPNEVRACDIGPLAGRFHALLLHADDTERQSMSPANLRTYIADVETQQRDLRVANACGDHEALADVVEGFLDSEGLVVPSEAATFAALCKAMLQAHLDALRGIVERIDGRAVQTPPPEQHPEVRSEDDLDDLDNAYRHWLAKAKPGSKTLAEIRPVFQRLKTYTGKSRISTITRHEVVKFQQEESSRLTAGSRVRPQTVNKHITLLGAIIRMAHKDELKQRGIGNPFEELSKLTVKSGDLVDRHYLSSEDAAKLFSGPVHTARARPIGGAGEAAYWMPIMGYGTGARMSELAQMYLSEVVQLDGIWCLWLTASPDGVRDPDMSIERSMKTGQSRRIVPLHPELLRLGFLDYVEWLRKQGAVRLFPLIRPDSKGNVAGNFSKWFNAYLRSIKLKRRGLDWISFRHLLKTQCRTLEIKSDVQDYIEGHQANRVSQNYGLFMPKTLHDAISAIPLPGLSKVPCWSAPVGRYTEGRA